MSLSGFGEQLDIHVPMVTATEFHAYGQSGKISSAQGHFVNAWITGDLEANKVTGVNDFEFSGFSDVKCGSNTTIQAGTANVSYLKTNVIQCHTSDEIVTNGVA